MRETVKFISLPVSPSAPCPFCGYVRNVGDQHMVYFDAPDEGALSGASWGCRIVMHCDLPAMVFRIDSTRY